MTEQELRARGRAMRRQLLGDEAIDQLDAELYTDQPHLEKFAETTQETVFGVLWARSGLDLKTRCLVTTVSDICTGQIEAMRLHIRFCLRHGWTEDELVETILQLMGYIGLPPARRALIAANEVFADVRNEQSAASGMGSG